MEKRDMLLNYKKIALVLVLFLLACAPEKTVKYVRSIEAIQSIDVSSKNYPLFGVAKIKSTLMQGDRIGAHYDGLLKIKQYNHLATGQVSEQAESKYVSIITEELKRAGYDVIEPLDLFGDDQTWKARFLFGGAIVSATVNTYGSLAGNYSESSVSVEWQLFDKEFRKILYKATSLGSTKISGNDREVIFEAFRASFRNLLANEKHLNTLDDYLSKTIVEDTIVKQIIYHDDFVVEPENIIECAQKAVIAIKTQMGHGSGFVINKEGYAITSFHVIEGMHTIDAILSDGKIIQAHVASTHPDNDLALIKLSGSGYDYLPLGDINKVAVGSTVYAIGTPVLLDLAQSVSKGIVSGYRKLPELTLVQTDASVNPGNSGGPLIDEKGKVLGIVASKLVKYGIEGLGFAISINDAINDFGLTATKGN